MLLTPVPVRVGIHALCALSAHACMPEAVMTYVIAAALGETVVELLEVFQSHDYDPDG